MLIMIIYKIIHTHIKYPTSNNLTRPWNLSIRYLALAHHSRGRVAREKDLWKEGEWKRRKMPPGKAREYFHPKDPRPNSPLSRGVALNTTTRRGILFLPSRRVPPPPFNALHYRRRVAYLNGRERERRDDRFASTYYVLWPAYARGEHWPPRSLLRGCTCCRELTLPLSAFPFSLLSSVSRRVLVPLVPSLPRTHHRDLAASATRPLLRPPHSTMARVTFTRYQDHS